MDSLSLDQITNIITNNTRGKIIFLITTTRGVERLKEIITDLTETGMFEFGSRRYSWLTISYHCTEDLIFPHVRIKREQGIEPLVFLPDKEPIGYNQIWGEG